MSTPRENSESMVSRKLIAAILAVVVITAAGILLAPQILVDRRPADFRIDGSVLSLTNKKGRVLWKFDTGMKNLVPESFYRDHYQIKRTLPEAEGSSRIHLPWLIIEDLDADGRNEILFAPQTDDDRGVGSLYLFDAKGRERWVFKPGREIISGDKTFSADFVIPGFVIHDFDKDRHPEIVILAHALNQYPTRFILLDSEKNIQGDFWNAGRFADVHFADLNRDDQEEILLAGQNYEYQRPCLIVLDWRKVKGCSPQGPAFAFAGLAPGSEKLNILFPRTAVDEINKSNISLWKVGVLSNERIQVASAPSEIFFELDFLGGFLSVILSHSYDLKYNEFIKQGLIKLPYDGSRIRRELEAGFQYYDGAAKAWVPRRANANSW